MRAPASGEERDMKWQLISAAAIAMPCVTAACDGSANLGQPSALPSAADAGNGATSGSPGTPSSGNDSPCVHVNGAVFGRDTVGSAAGEIVQHDDQRNRGRRRREQR
jgi:hypothetical protein